MVKAPALRAFSSALNCPFVRHQSAAARRRNHPDALHFVSARANAGTSEIRLMVPVAAISVGRGAVRRPNQFLVDKLLHTHVAEFPTVA